jgi:hypothetical protein
MFTSSTRVHDLLMRAALREALCHLWPAPPKISVAVEVVRCPVCGADERTVRTHALSLPRDIVPEVIAHGSARPPGEVPVLAMLGCESVTSRSLMAIAAVGDAAGKGATWQTRSVALTHAGLLSRRRPDPAEALLLISAQEHMLDGRLGVPLPVEGMPPIGSEGCSLTLPCSTRILTDPAVTGHFTSETSFLSPHLKSPQLDGFERSYRSHLLDAVASGV